MYKHIVANISWGTAIRKGLDSKSDIQGHYILHES